MTATTQPRLDGATTDDLEAVRGAARDYIEGFLAGDAERHARAYHPECLKRRFDADGSTGIPALLVISPTTMADYAGASPPDPDCRFEIVVDAISADIASVRVYSDRWVDFLHVVRARGAWRLFHVTWHSR